VGKPMKPISPKRDDVSAVTGRAMGKITEENTRQWQSNRPGGTPTAAVVRSEASIDLEKLPKAQMKFIEPMLANLVGTLPEGPQQQYEIKFDGYRAIAIRDDKVRLLSRRSNVLNDRIRPIARALEAIEPGTIVDGEVVALD
jgi:bifunctional non-homologous end joining protein LigD